MERTKKVAEVDMKAAAEAPSRFDRLVAYLQARGDIEAAERLLAQKTAEKKPTPTISGVVRDHGPLLQVEKRESHVPNPASKTLAAIVRDHPPFDRYGRTKRSS